jgi:hypothetical protein
MYGWVVVAVADAERDGVEAARIAVQKAQTDAKTTCDGRVASVQAELAQEALQTAAAAQEANERAAELRRQLEAAEVDRREAVAVAADITKVAPVILDLCRTRASCRERHKLATKQ